MFNPNRPYDLAVVLRSQLECVLNERNQVGLEDAMTLLIDVGFVASEPMFGMSRAAWKQGRLILWAMRLASEKGKLRSWFPHLDPLVGVDAAYFQIKFVKEAVQHQPWTEERVDQGEQDRIEVIGKFKSAFNSYAHSRKQSNRTDLREKRDYLQQCLEDVMRYIDEMASPEELAIDEARRWVASADRPEDGNYRELRESFPRAHCSWTNEEVEHLLNAREYQLDLVSVSSLLLRTPAEILFKSEEVLGSSGWDVN